MQAHFLKISNGKAAIINLAVINYGYLGKNYSFII